MNRSSTHKKEGSVYPLQDKDMEKEIQKAFNDSVGTILTFLDEAGVSLTLKRAVKSEMWDLCDKKIKPLFHGVKGNGLDVDGNR